MAHFARVRDGRVQNVIVAEQDFIDFISKSETEPGVWIQCSYNTQGGVHLNGGKPLRKNFPSKGFLYNKKDDAFYAPQPFPSWTLNTTSYIWEPPVALPSDADTVRYRWDEENSEWVQVP
tara:strand:- start:59 stop:418 length:360 start_codon:yes stop_codon:yes gene_type:complete